MINGYYWLYSHRSRAVFNYHNYNSAYWHYRKLRINNVTDCRSATEARGDHPFGDDHHTARCSVRGREGVGSPLLGRQVRVIDAKPWGAHAGGTDVCGCHTRTSFEVATKRLNQASHFYLPLYTRSETGRTVLKP
jgi:hypothetical protein